MTGIGSGEYPAIDIAGLLIDVMVLVLTGVKDQASTVGQLIAIAIVIGVLGSLVAGFAIVFGLFIATLMKMGKMKKG